MSEFTGDMTSAVEAAFAAPSTPDVATTTTTETQPASAVETPVTEVSQEAVATTQTSEEPKERDVPYVRFKDVNDKWTTASKELEKLGWAKGVDPRLVQEFARVQQIAQTNPLIWTEQLEAVRDHPVLGPQLRSWAARTLGFRNAPKQEAPVEDAMPEPDMHFEGGQSTYSDKQMAKRDQWLLKQWESKIDEKVAPLANKSAATEKYVADQVFDGIKAKADGDARTEIDSLKQQYPQFWDHREEIASVMEANPSFTLKQAWAQVFVDKVGPQLAAGNAATVKAKVSAGTANPSRPSGAVASAPKDFYEALLPHFPTRNN